MYYTLFERADDANEGGYEPGEVLYMPQRRYQSSDYDELKADYAFEVTQGGGFPGDEDELESTRAAIEPQNEEEEEPISIAELERGLKGLDQPLDQPHVRRISEGEELEGLEPEDIDENAIVLLPDDASEFPESSAQAKTELEGSNVVQASPEGEPEEESGVVEVPEEPEASDAKQRIMKEIDELLADFQIIEGFGEQKR